MNVSIIGSGNVAWHFAKFFYRRGHRITHIYNRTEQHGRALAAIVDAQFCPNLDNLALSAVDLLVIAVNDDSIPEVVQKLTPEDHTIVVHTSGATPMSILSRCKRYGVIYPPQTIRKDVDSPMAEIPFAIEGSNENVTDILLGIMQEIAPKSFRCNSEQRLALHVASVFANNFSNALYQVAYEMLERQGLDFELLRPIIFETAKNVQNNVPQAVQTGPAARNDKNTINKHLQLLSDNDEVRKIYQQLTSFLIKRRHNT
jgi:predicted short-subunit dehydrogenase-like oxidoreductase (DUF2520 family)